jgi:hypothetical protein
MSGSEIVDRVFEAEFHKADVSVEEKKWLEMFPGEKVATLDRAAHYLMKELDHFKLKNYDPGEHEYPPCSIMRSAHGKKMNCVGRVASLVLLSELMGYKTRPGERMMIEIQVDYTQNLDGTLDIEDGHITAYTDLWGEKEYLGTSYDYESESYGIKMLPSVYALQTALMRIREEKYQEAKDLAKMSRSWNINDSRYISHLNHRIING